MVYHFIGLVGIGLLFDCLLALLDYLYIGALVFLLVGLLVYRCTCVSAYRAY